MADVTYRDIRETDFDNLHRLCSEWEVVRQLGSWPWPPDPAFTLSRCVPFKGNGFVWAICSDDQLIGTVGVTDGTLGYMLSPDYAGRGLMTAAVERALDAGFKTFDLIKACTWFDNPASARVLTKHGFERIGTCVDPSPARGEDVETHSYELTRDRWQTLRSQAQ